MAESSGMSGMGAWALPIMTVLGGAFDYASKTSAAKSLTQSAQRTQQGAYFQASQLDQQAGQQEAASQIAAGEVGRKAGYDLSRIQAMAAYQGGATNDPTVLILKARLMADAAYNEAMKLQHGAEAARGLRMQGAAARYMGDTTVLDAQAAKGSARSAAGASLLKTGAGLLGNMFGGGSKSMAEKYNAPYEVTGIGHSQNFEYVPDALPQE